MENVTRSEIFIEHTRAVNFVIGATDPLQNFVCRCFSENDVANLLQIAAPQSIFWYGSGKSGSSQSHIAQFACASRGTHQSVTVNSTPVTAEKTSRQSGDQFSATGNSSSITLLFDSILRVRKARCRSETPECATRLRLNVVGRRDPCPVHVLLCL